VGVGENMNNPLTDRRIFLNSDASHFILNLNQNLGTVEGFLSAEDYSNPADIFLSDLDIGGSLGSAMTLSDSFIAVMDGGRPLSISMATLEASRTMPAIW
jgi:hypothetical protein